MTWVRAGTSALVLGAGAFVLCLCLRVLVDYPLWQSEYGDVQDATALVVFPLLLSAGCLTGLLLLWAGVRGALAAHDPGRWRYRQRVALHGCLIGALVAGFVVMAADRPWTGLSVGARIVGLQLLVFAGLLAFMIMVLLSAEGNPR
ncbi:hypothetical protein LO762_13390 [Actinocorallia sp. API 0066]|uniref:hypothetical protein n=1 Tax=Actinocorallia sp. API 0066 TaxID=2896846 RepID=UPI001E56DDE7|nr:hypothetical protein [Actinocorallia sp. API 0066]MCD0450179.1 hypothetical protein [Actinocorallia sp. API 0066]